ncbi:MAG TPA: YfiR family protein [Nitrospirales bacterium]
MQLTLLGTLWISVSGELICLAQSQGPSLHQVQAQVLFNFTKFVTWPDDAFQHTGTSLIIGVLGDDHFGLVLEEALRDKTVMGKTLAIKRFQTIQDAATSHILFLSSSEESHLPQIIKTLQQTTVLTVSDMDEFAERGGMVALTLDDQKVHFKVNLDAVERAGLKLGSELLKLAKIVGDQPRTGK